MIAFIQKLKNKKGFTLVELIVVIAIIAILTAVLIPVIGNYTADANKAADEQTKKEIETSVGIELSEMGTKGIKFTAGTVPTITITIVKDTSVTCALSTGTLSDTSYTLAANLGIRCASLKTHASGVYTVNFAALGDDYVINGIVWAPSAT